MPGTSRAPAHVKESGPEKGTGCLCQAVLSGGSLEPLLCTSGQPPRRVSKSGAVRKSRDNSAGPWEAREVPRSDPGFRLHCCDPSAVDGGREGREVAPGSHRGCCECGARADWLDLQLEGNSGSRSALLPALGAASGCTSELSAPHLLSEGSAASPSELRGEFVYVAASADTQGAHAPSHPQWWGLCCQASRNVS